MRNAKVVVVVVVYRALVRPFIRLDPQKRSELLEQKCFQFHFELH